MDKTPDFEALRKEVESALEGEERAEALRDLEMLERGHREIEEYSRQQLALKEQEAKKARRESLISVTVLLLLAVLGIALYVG